jgi:MFS transporter, OFA family, oxalate/formate antiporter
VLSGLVFFGWGEIFSLFPSTLTDTFGSRYATTNYGFLYIAQGLGSILGGPVAAAMRVATGSWTPVFGLAVAMDIATALLALFVLKQMRAAYLGPQLLSSSAEFAPARSRSRATLPLGGR